MLFQLVLLLALSPYIATTHTHFPPAKDFSTDDANVQKALLLLIPKAKS